MEDSVIFWHSKISSGVLERPIPKSDSRSRDSSWPNRTPLSAKGRPSRLPTFTNAVQPVQRTYALEKWEDGIEIGGKFYNNLRYADDVALLATTEGKLQELVNDVGKASERFGLSLNAKKTQVMVIGRHTSSINIMYNGAPLEQVKQFIYLGASFNEKGDTIKEVKRRIAIAKRASGDLHRIWRNRELPIPLKRKLVQLMIWPIMSYGSETWIYLKSVQNMIKVFERWC